MKFSLLIIFEKNSSSAFSFVLGNILRIILLSKQNFCRNGNTIFSGEYQEFSLILFWLKNELFFVSKNSEMNIIDFLPYFLFLLIFIKLFSTEPTGMNFALTNFENKFDTSLLKVKK